MLLRKEDTEYSQDIQSSQGKGRCIHIAPFLEKDESFLSPRQGRSLDWNLTASPQLRMRGKCAQSNMHQPGREHLAVLRICYTFNMYTKYLTDVVNLAHSWAITLILNSMITRKN